MDDIDQRLLAAITDNARTPLKQVAERAGLSREAAHYRLRKLEKRGIITGYKARTSRSHTHIMFLQMVRGGTHFLDFLREKYPHWIGRASSWDVLCLFSSQNPQEHVNDILGHLGNDVNKYMVLEVTEELADSFAPAFGGSNFVPEVRDGKTDEIDERIMGLLSRDAKLTNKEMGREVGLSDEAVRYRVGKLEEGPILGYRAIINLRKAGFNMYFVTLDFARPGTIDADNFIYAAHTQGRHGFCGVLAAQSIEDANEQLEELKLDFVRDWQMFPMLGYVV